MTSGSELHRTTVEIGHVASSSDTLMSEAKAGYRFEHMAGENSPAALLRKDKP